MIAPEYLHRLEYDKIVARLAENTAFSAGRQLALALTPSPDPKVVRRRQQETTEAKDAACPSAPMSPWAAPTMCARWRARAASGAHLEPRELLDIRGTLFAARTLRYSLAAHWPSTIRCSAKRPA